ncbi:MAG TPA: hypothetical protein VJ255_18305, partial [Candidatus Acidoferrum sp.]|nr:hypothetical protein [Candidatus Acidoferrum sp.]
LRSPGGAHRMRTARKYWREEEEAFDGRSPPSKETELGIVSNEAVGFLERAADYIEIAVVQLRSAIGDDSFPESDPIYN